MVSAGSTSAHFSLRDPDVRLMLRVRADDTGAFEELVQKYQHRLLGILTHLVGRADEAEDLAQEVFLRVYRARAEYHPQAKFSTWLFTIANNVALNALRRRQRKPAVQLPPSDSGPMTRPEEKIPSHRSPPPDQRLDHLELSGMIQNALEQLGDRQRLAVVLNKFEDLSYDEIAEIMGVSSKAVKSLLSRARAQLRELLLPYVGGEAQALPAPASSEEEP